MPSQRWHDGYTINANVLQRTGERTHAHACMPAGEPTVQLVFKLGNLPRFRPGGRGYLSSSGARIQSMNPSWLIFLFERQTNKEKSE